MSTNLHLEAGHGDFYIEIPLKQTPTEITYKCYYNEKYYRCEYFEDKNRVGWRYKDMKPKDKSKYFRSFDECLNMYILYAKEDSEHIKDLLYKIRNFQERQWKLEFYIL